MCGINNLTDLGKVCQGEASPRQRVRGVLRSGTPERNTSWVSNPTHPSRYPSPPCRRMGNPATFVEAQHRRSEVAGVTSR